MYEVSAGGLPRCYEISQFQCSDTILWVGWLGGVGSIFLFPPVGLCAVTVEEHCNSASDRINTAAFRGLWSFMEPDCCFMFYVIQPFILQHRKWTCVTCFDSWIKSNFMTHRRTSTKVIQLFSFCRCRMTITFISGWVNHSWGGKANAKDWITGCVCLLEDLNINFFPHKVF